MKKDQNLGDYIKTKPWRDKYVKTHEVTNLYRRAIGGIPEHIKAQIAKSIHVKFDTLNMSTIESGHYAYLDKNWA